MPPTPKHHLTRKELKQPDEFRVVISTVQEFVEDHLREVIGGAVALCLIAALAFGLYQHHRTVARQAAQNFYLGFQAFKTKDYKTAEQYFSSLASGYPGTGPGRMAEFYLGLAYLDQGKLPQAQAKLEAYASQAQESAMRQMALLNLGVAYEQAAQLAKAEAAYSRAAATDGPRTADASLAAARVLAAEGKRDAAITAYRRFLAENPYSDQRPDATEALARLGVSPLGGH